MQRTSSLTAAIMLVVQLLEERDEACSELEKCRFDRATLEDALLRANAELALIRARTERAGARREGGARARKKT